MRNTCCQILVVFIFVLGIFMIPDITEAKHTDFPVKHDRDEYGKFAKDELPRLHRDFDSSYNNQDGYLAKEENQKARKEKSKNKKKGYFKKHDKNEDGKISKDEFPGSDKAFEKIDKNQDGYIDKDEARKARKKRAKRNKKYLKKHDKNEDGKLSKDEFPGSDEAFDKFDKNQDGFIDQREVRKYRKEKSKQENKDKPQKKSKDKDGADPKED